MVRNCACRGDAGWAHIACLAEFAANKVTEVCASKVTEAEQETIDITLFWNNCIICKTPHMQYVGVAMADAFVKHYEHLPDTNKLRFGSLSPLAMCRFDVGDHDGALELYDRLRQTCAFLTSTGIDLRRREGQMYRMIGRVFLKKLQLNDALSAFERQRELYVAIYGPNHPDIKENNEIIVKLKKKIGYGDCGHTDDPAAELVRARELFRENQECADIRHKFYFHSKLVRALRNDGKIQESIKEFENLLAESRQSLGPDHPDTLVFENNAAIYGQGTLQLESVEASHFSAAGATASQKKDVWAVIECDQQPAISGQRVQVLRATKDAQKYICLIKNHYGVSSKFKVTHNQCILETGTTVVVHGLVSSIDLKGSIGIIRLFDKEKQRYAVSVGKKKTTVSIKPMNLNVVFT